jgi:hypothetical protein
MNLFKRITEKTVARTSTISHIKSRNTVMAKRTIRPRTVAENSALLQYGKFLAFSRLVRASLNSDADRTSYKKNSGKLKTMLIEKQINNMRKGFLTKMASLGLKTEMRSSKIQVFINRPNKPIV